MDKNINAAFNMVWKNLVIAIVYLLVAKLAETYIIPGNVVAPIFPSAGIAFAAVLWWGYGILPGVWLGAFLDIFIFNQNIWLSLAVGSAATLEAFFGAWLLLKLTKTRTPFYHTYDVAVFTFGSAFLACTINATVGTTGLLLLHLISSSIFTIAWLNWWIGESIGVIALGTAILVWHHAHVQFTKSKFAELMILLLLLNYFMWLLYVHHWSLDRILLLFAVWSAIRLGLQITALVGLYISVIVFHWSINWYYALRGITVSSALLFAQIFIAIVFFITAMINAALAEREKAKQRLITANTKLESRVKQRTHDLAEKNTELHQTLVDLKTAQSQLIQAEKMSALGILTAGIAHEINNSVNFISANISPLKNNVADILNVLKQYVTASDDAKLQEKIPAIKKLTAQIDLDFTINETDLLLNSIREGAQRTTAIVKDLRTFSRLDESDLKTVDIHHNIDSTLNLLKSYYKDRIKIIKHYGEIPAIECYPGKLNQVIMNLLSNAIQAIPSQGEITITTMMENNQFVLHIKDTGTGMSEEVQHKIFEPFFTTKPVGQGTGLGLSISYKIIQDHHGTITVQSEPGNGTEFVIRLPSKQS